MMRRDRIPTEINSVSSYIKAVFTLKESQTAEESNSSFWFFRGQKNSVWPMMPTAFRNDALSIEYEAIESALRQRPYDFRECSSDFEILTKLQHYGLGTRLLDVTLNPLVALYFASEPHDDIIEDKYGRGKKVPRDGKVVYHYGYGHKLSELGVRIGCALPFLNFQQHYTIKDLAIDLKAKNIISSEEYSSLCANNYENFLALIQCNNFVVSSYSNDRLIRQSGSFIVPTSIKIYDSGKNLGDSIIRKSYCSLDAEFEKRFFIIPHEKKEQIRDELDFLNINEATLFPELEHQLIYLQKKKPAKIGSVEMFERYQHSSEAFSDNDFETESTNSFQEPKPDIDGIVNSYLSDFPYIAKDVQNIIEKAITMPDWWSRDTILSQINRDITRTVQSKKSMAESKSIANHIIDCLRAGITESPNIIDGE